MTVRKAILELFGPEAEAHVEGTVLYECRHCGAKFDELRKECLECGADEIATYVLEEEEREE